MEIEIVKHYTDLGGTYIYIHVPTIIKMGGFLTYSTIEYRVFYPYYHRKLIGKGKIKKIIGDSRLVQWIDFRSRLFYGPGEYTKMEFEHPTDRIVYEDFYNKENEEKIKVILNAKEYLCG